MIGTQVIPVNKINEILSSSICEQRRAVLTLREAGGWRTLSATLSSGSKQAGVVIVSLPSTQEDGHHLPARGDTVGISFRLGHKKCMFSAIVRNLEAASGGAWVSLDWPVEVLQLQRRAYERIAPPRGSIIAVRFWRQDETGKRDALERIVRHGQLEDLSAGGMMITFAYSQEMEAGRTYRCVFAPYPGAATVVVDATLRHQQSTDHGRASLGFQFIGLETTAEGRKTLGRLAHIAGRYQSAGGLGKKSKV